MNKKVMVISLLVIVCTISISGCIIPISEISKLINSDDGVVVLDGIKFNLPKGYNVSLNSTDNPSTVSVDDNNEVDTTYSLISLEKNDKSLDIFVTSFDDKGDLDDCYDYKASYSDSKTINGVSGLYFNVTTDGVTSHHFTYIKNDKLVEFMTNDTVDVISETLIG